MTRLRSRISGRTVEAGPEPVIPGLYEVDEGDAANRRRAVQGGLGPEEKVAFWGVFPPERDTAALDKVVSAIGGGDAFEALAAALPIVPHVDEASRFTTLDRCILTHLPHLQHVCHRPRLHLRVEEERVPVSRARRVPARAVASLVAHPEDWEHRTLRNVRPARLLSALVEDQFDLYENRVAVRLVDHLLTYVGERLEDLRRIKKERDEAEDFRDASRGSYWRARRMYQLLGDYFTSDGTGRELDTVMKALDGAQRDLQGLLGSVLYKEVPRNTFVAPALRPTNILVNDPHYRKVAALWRAWAKDGHKPHPTREQIRNHRQSACRSFDRFARLLLCRALHDLGYTPSSRRTGHVWALSAPHGSAELRWEPDGTMTLDASGERLHVVPVLTRAPSDASIAAQFWTSLRAEAKAGGDTLVLFLGHPDDILSLPPELARAFSGLEAPRALPVAPWSLDSVERVARVLRSWEGPLRHRSYPLRATVRPDPGIPLPRWLHRVRDEVAVTMPPSDAEREAFLATCERGAADLERQRAEALRARQAWDPGRRTALDALRALAIRSKEQGHFLRCPVCDSADRTEFKPQPDTHGIWERFAFRCVCLGCSSTLGLRMCGGCERSFLVLEADVKLPPPGDVPLRASWIDQAYGRDVFAEPCWLRNEKRREFRCPRCGVCTGGGCERCGVREPSGSVKKRLS